jgi:hypothetical protein
MGVRSSLKKIKLKEKKDDGNRKRWQGGTGADGNFSKISAGQRKEWITTRKI